MWLLFERIPNTKLFFFLDYFPWNLPLPGSIYFPRFFMNPGEAAPEPLWLLGFRELTLPRVGPS